MTGYQSYIYVHHVADDIPIWKCFFFIVYNTLIMSVLDHVRPFCEWIFEWHFPPHSEIDLYIQEIISLFYVSFVIYAFVVVITLYEQTELMVKLSSGRKVFMTSLMIPNV